MFKAKTIIEEVKSSHQQIYKNCFNAIKESKSDLDFQRIDKNSFNKCPNISIDVAIMENRKRNCHSSRCSVERCRQLESSMGII